MATLAEGVATHVAQASADRAMQELHYLCCYNSYVEGFEDEKKHLRARRHTIQKDIEEANYKNENQIESEVQLWVDEADRLIKEDTKEKKKWFGLVTNCFWQYRRGKDLEDYKTKIQRLMEESNNFRCIARSTGLPGIEFHSIENFTQLKDRKLQFGKLMEALKDDKKFMIGLYGLGGTGKTTMAIEVGKEVARLKVFDKVIFCVVSKDANFKNIRENIAKHLNLPLNEGKDESLKAQDLWKRITEGAEKVLLILDDVWEELKLQDIGIHLGRHDKGCCSILLTTRDLRVCSDMGCHETIKLEVLNEKDAIDLFLSYAGKSTDDSSKGFKYVASGIVKECGRLPVAIVAVARALKSRSLKEWKHCLERLRNLELVHDVTEDLKEVYNSLRISYDNLKDEKAKQLFLLCSLFPEDYEIPIELLTRIAIGLEFCGGANKYSTARSRFTPIIDKLIDSCLLLKVSDEYVKMHDLVREVALWIGNKQVQVAMDSNITLMDDIRYSSWNIIDFPSHFCGRKLEVLLVWINNASSSSVKVPNAYFEGMENLKILALMSQSKLKISAASLFQSPLSLTNVRTLSVQEFELGDISLLANFKSLESLKLSRCSIFELPNKIIELQNLRLLEMIGCLIERNNPFEVIGSCFRLEELYYASNNMHEGADEPYLTQITTLPKLRSYHIAGPRSIENSKVDFSSSTYFDSKGLRVNFSKEIFKSLLAKAEVVMLEGDDYNRGCTNIVPNILYVANNNMDDHLARLHLQSMKEIKCLIYTHHLPSGVTIFSNLVELHLVSMNGVRELCYGPYPVDFLKQLKKLQLSNCKNLEGTLLDEKIELCNLKSIILNACSMTCLFHPSTAQSLKQLEILKLANCFKLKYIVAETMDDHNLSQKSNDSMFPKLKHLTLQKCHELEFILPVCFCKDLPLLEAMTVEDCEKLKHIFGQHPEERDLRQIEKEVALQLLENVEISRVPNFINIYAECYLPWPCSDEAQKSCQITKVEDVSSSNLSRGHLCCFWPKSNASTLHHPSASKTTQPDHNQALKEKYVANRAHGLFTPPLYPYKSLRSMKIVAFSGLKTLFTLSIASTLELLEMLEVTDCDTLEQIVTYEEHDQDHMNVISIFPNLLEVNVSNCSRLEYIFPAVYSKDFKNLKSLNITKAENLTHVFGKCYSDHNHNVQNDLNFPAMKTLHLVNLPNMISICAQNYSIKELYLQDVSWGGCPRIRLETLMDLLVVWHKSQEDISKRKALSLEEKGKPLSNLHEFHEFKEPRSHISFQNIFMLKLKGCNQLKYILSASTSRMLQKLKKLVVSDCEELVSIVEEDEENQKNPKVRHQICFPELRAIIVKHCKSLECLFSISSGNKLPRLLYVNIEDAPQLGELFRCKQREGQKLDMKDVCPELYGIRLVNLPALHTICQGIDFHNVEVRLVLKCPTISLTSQRNLFQGLSLISHLEDSRYYFDILLWRVEPWKASKKKIFKNDTTEHEQDSDLPNLTKPWKASKKKIAKNDTTKHEQDSDLPNLTERTKSTNTPGNEIVEAKLSTTLSSNLEMNLKATSIEGPSKESMGDDQQALGESRCSNNNEAPQRVEEPTNECSFKETSNQMALTILPSIIGMAPPSCQIATSSTDMEMESGSSATTYQSAQNCKETFGEDPSSSEKHDRTSSSTYSKSKIQQPNTLAPSKESMDDDQQALGERRSSNNEAPQEVEELPNECSSKETPNQMALAIPPSIIGMTPQSISSIPSPKKRQIETPSTHVEMESGSSAITDQSVQDKIMNQQETSTGKQIKFDQGNHQQFAEDDLMRLFQIIEEGAEMEVPMPYRSKIAAFEDDNELSKALADVEASLKMSLSEIACSEERKLCLESALNILSSHCSEDGVPSHGLQASIHYLKQEILTVLSSSKHAYATIDTFNKLEQEENLLIEERSKRKEAAIALLSGIHNKESSLAEAQLKETELKEKISKLQAELYSKEKEIQEFEMELMSLKEQKKNSVPDTMGFIKKFEGVKRERCHMVEETIMAKQHLQNLNVKWSSCLSNLKKTTLLLGVHLQQKL